MPTISVVGLVYAFYRSSSPLLLQSLSLFRDSERREASVEAFRRRRWKQQQQLCEAPYTLRGIAESSHTLGKGAALQRRSHARFLSPLLAQRSVHCSLRRSAD